MSTPLPKASSGTRPALLFSRRLWLASAAGGALLLFFLPLPKTGMPPAWQAAEDSAHVVLFLLLACLPWPQLWWRRGLSLALAAGAIELVQPWFERQGTWEDWGFGLVGVAAGLLLRSGSRGWALAGVALAVVVAGWAPGWALAETWQRRALAPQLGRDFSLWALQHAAATPPPAPGQPLRLRPTGHPFAGGRLLLSGHDWRRWRALRIVASVTRPAPGSELVLRLDSSPWGGPYRRQHTAWPWPPADATTGTARLVVEVPLATLAGSEVDLAHVWELLLFTDPYHPLPESLALEAVTLLE